MSWPPPTSTLAPPTVHGEDTHADDTRAEKPGDRTGRRSPMRDALAAVTPAAWVAAIGGALVLLAAAIVVVGNWDAIGRSVRVAGLTLGTVGLIAASERLRRPVPTTASIIGHVGTFLTTTVGIAAMSLAGFTWPACLAVGGGIAVLATQLQMARWPRGAFGAGQVVAIALAATGAGALTGATGGLLAGIAATGLLAAGAHRRAAALALVAVCSPALAALTEAGIGAGTFERAGLVGERLSWSGPVVGALAALVLGTVAVQRRNNGLMVSAALAPLLGAVTGLVAIDGSAVAWFALPGFVVIAAELTWWILPGDALRRQIGTVIDGVSGAVAIGVVVAAPGLGSSFHERSGTMSSIAIPLAVGVLAMALATMRWRADERRLADLGLASLAALAIGLGLAIGANAVVVAAIAVAATIASGWASRTLHAVAVHVPAAWAASTIMQIDADDVGHVQPVGLALLATLVAFVVFVRARRAGGHRLMGPVELFAVVTVTASVAAEIALDHASLVALMAVAATAGAFMLAERRFVPWAAGLMGLSLALLAFTAAWEGEFDTMWIGAALATSTFAAAWRLHDSRVAAHVTAAGTLVSAAMALVAAGIGAEQFFALALTATIASSGLAVLTGRATPLDSAAATAGLLLLASSWATERPAWISVAWIVVGLQFLVVGTARRRLSIAALGAPPLMGGLVSLWFTSGWHDLLTDWLAPADIRVGDLWMAAATVAALVAGIVARRSNGTNSWLAFGPALVIAAAWLVPVQVDRSTDWALPLALAIGAAAVGLGAAKRLAAPLVGGIALVGVSAFVALDSDLAAVPAWIWFGIGGVALLVTATAIERSSRTETSMRDLVDRWN